MPPDAQATTGKRLHRHGFRCSGPPRVLPESPLLRQAIVSGQILFLDEILARTSAAPTPSLAILFVDPAARHAALPWTSPLRLVPLELIADPLARPKLKLLCPGVPRTSSRRPAPGAAPLRPLRLCFFLAAAVLFHAAPLLCFVRAATSRSARIDQARQAPGPACFFATAQRTPPHPVGLLPLNRAKAHG
ncbi:uncharacterized protein LOC119314679 [Triticum dicoccoides]|uniref:uncharacterized protein LOC119314679 n=1 Tax=Triticum dicoccoides TaxID=85692 RepID=UPI00189186C4|nr:uncharacterized protein LOC119314679 [Triticum dicoccoides]